MITFVKKLAQALGFDRAVNYAVFAQMWKFVAGPVTLLLIATRFSPELQGFYYTFASLLAMQIFFELGLNQVIVTFVSHEFGKLKWEEGGRVVGDAATLLRFRGLFVKFVRWFGFLALLLFSALAAGGLLFFHAGKANAAGIFWEIPWLFAVAATALNLFTAPFWAVVIGSEYRRAMLPGSAGNGCG